jgi:hypothetical protein
MSFFSLWILSSSLFTGPHSMNILATLIAHIHSKTVIHESSSVDFKAACHALPPDYFLESPSISHLSS